MREADAPGPGTRTGGTTVLAVSVVPGSRETRVVEKRADGSWRISVKAPPTDGKANEELVRFLASEFSVPRSCVRIAAGASTRRKLVRIEGAALAPDWLR